MTNDEKIARLATVSWAPAIPVSEGRRQANWVIRTERTLEADVAALGQQVQQAVRKLIQEQYGESYEPPALEAALPEVAMLAVDDRHLVVRITLGDGGLAVAEPGMAATLATLQKTDELVAIEELQGYPRRYWSLVLPKPAGAP